MGNKNTSVKISTALAIGDTLTKKTLVATEVSTAFNMGDI